MTQTILSYLLPFLIGIGVMYAIQKPQPLPEAKTEYISMGTFNETFSQPERFHSPHLGRLLIVTDTVETKPQIVDIPVTHLDRSRDLNLFWGDTVTVESDRVQLGFFNTASGQWQIQQYDIPVRPWDFYSDLWIGYPLQLEAGMTLAHRSGVFGRVKAGYLQFNGTPYLGVGLGIKF